MVLEGEILESTQAAFKTAIEALEDAYAQQGQDAIFYHDDGTESAHKIISNDTVSGTLVKSVEFHKGDNPESYATEKAFRIVLEAEYDTSESDILYWKEYNTPRATDPNQTAQPS